MNDLQKLYDVLKRDGYYTKSFDEFKVQWQDQAYKDKVYGVVSRDGLYTKGKDEFFTKYSGAPSIEKQEPLKKKEPTAFGSAESSSAKLPKTEPKVTESLPSKGKPDGSYSFPGEDNAIYKKENGQWYKAFTSDYKFYPITKGDVESRVSSLEKNALSTEQYGFEKEPRVEAPQKYQALPKQTAPAKPLTTAQKQQQAVFDKSFGVVSEAEYQKRKAESDAIASKVGQITSDLIDYSEGDVVPRVQEIIKDYPYLQVSESGVGYDELEIKNTITGESQKINLDNWSSDRDKEEAKRLQGFLDIQMSSKDYVNQYDKVNKLRAQLSTATPTQRIDLSEKLLEEQAKLTELKNGRYNKAKSDKYKSAAIYDKNAKENIKTDFAKLQMQAIDYSEKAKSYSEWEATVNDAKSKGLITQEQYDMDYAPKLAQEKNMLIEERNKINENFKQTQFESTSIDNIAADNFAIEAERGNIITGTAFSALQGAENSLRFLIETGPFEQGDFKGLLTEALPGSISTEYTSSESRNVLEQIVFGLANSGGSALVGAAVGSPTLGLYASSYVNMKDQMSTPEFKDVPEWQKILMSGVYGATIGYLEEKGIGKWFQKTPAGKGLTNWILKKTIAELGEDATTEAIELSIKKNLNAAISNGLIQVTASGLVEGSTELAQEAADMVYKDVFNKLSEKKYFENPDSWAGVVDRLSQSFLLGFAGGAGMNAISQTTQIAKNELTKSQVNNIAQLIDDPELYDTFKLNLKEQILSGQISKDEARRQVEKINEVQGTLNQIPKDVDRYSAFKLINERDEIQKQIEGKDPNLVAAQTERVKEINDQLKQLSYAVQEQATGQVPVQSEAGTSGEVAQGEPQARPQEATQEGEQVQEKITVFRGTGNNVMSSENSSTLWVAEDEEVAKNYAGPSEDGTLNVETLEVDKPSNPIEMPYKLATDVRGSDIANNLRGIVAELKKSGELPKENISKALELISDFESKAGDNLELFTAKLNKPEANEAFSKAVQALGFDGVVQKEAAAKGGQMTNTYGIFKNKYSNLLQPVVQETVQSEVQKLPEAQPDQRFEFTPETLPEQLKNVEPEMGVTEVRKRLFGKKEKAKLVFSGQQMIDAGLAVAPGTKQEVNETIQERPIVSEQGTETGRGAEGQVARGVQPTNKREGVKKSLEQLRDSGLLVSAQKGQNAMTNEEIDALMSLSDAMASVWAETTGNDNFYETFIDEVKAGDIEAIKEKGGILFQNVEIPQAPISRVSLAVFNLPEFKKMQGTNVALQNIKDMIKSRGKEIEKDIINRVLDFDKYQGVKRVDFDEFKNDVDLQVMKLEKIETTTYADYGMDNLGNNETYGVAETIVYNSPVDHGQKGHFSGDFISNKLKPRNWEVRELPGTNQYIAIDADVPAGLVGEQLMPYVGTAGNKQSVEKWIENRNRASQNSELNVGLFGHIRGWYHESRNRYYLAEAQSDYFQKNKASDLYRTIIDKTKLQDLMSSRLSEQNKKIIKQFEEETGYRTQVDFFPNTTKFSIYKDANLIYQDEINNMDYVIYDEKDAQENAINFLNTALRRMFTEVFSTDSSRREGIELGKKIWMAENNETKIPSKEELLDEDIKIEREIRKWKNVRDSVRNIRDFNEAENKINELREKSGRLKERIINASIDDSGFLKLAKQSFELKSDRIDDEMNNFAQELSREVTKLEEKLIDEAKNSKEGDLILKQFIASQKVHEIRLFREAVKHAAEVGATELWFPSPYTLAIIEGYVSGNGSIAPYEITSSRYNDELNPGDTIDYEGEEYVVIDSDRDSFKAAPRDYLNVYYIHDYIDSEVDYYVYDALKSDFNKQFGDGISQKDISKYQENESYSHIVLSELIEYSDNNPDQDVILWDDIEEAVADRVRDSLYREDPSVLFSGDIYFDRDTYYVVDNSNWIQEFQQPNEYDDTDGSNFESKLSDTQKTVVNKYKEFNKYIEKTRPDARFVADDNGRTWIKTNITQDDLINPIIAFQNEGGRIKGAIDFQNDNKASVYIFDGADISTLAHEITGHLGRRVLEKLSEQDENFAKDYQTAMDWAGVFNGEWSVAADEKFARGFEKYLRDGKAPTAALKNVFEKLRSWLINIYRKIKGSSIDIELTPEITAVFDNLLRPQKEAKVEQLRGFDRMMSELDGIIEKSRKRRASEAKVFENAMNYLQGSAVYERATDVQREQMVRDLRKKFGKREKSAPSVKKLFGEVKDVKKITMPEYDLMVKQIMDFEKGAKTTLAKVTKASKELTAYVKEMVKKGHITTNQAVSVLRRFSATNLLDENSVSNFVNYMRKVFNDAEYANKIANVRKKLPTAKKNIKTKIGVAKDLAPLMERVFAINPSIIPDEVFNKYSDAVMMMGERAAVLSLKEYSEIKENLIDVIDAVEMEAGLAEELVDLFNDNKVVEEGKVNFSETLNKMFDEGLINEYERSLMRKYKSLFTEKKAKESKKEEKVAEAKEAVASATINTADLPTKDERDVAKKLAKLVKAKAYEMLTDKEIIQLSKVINNINNGFLTHKAEQLRERMSGLVKAKDLISPIQQVKVMFGELLKGNLKSKVTGENVYTNIIKGNSAAFIDEVFGNFKERPFFNNIYEPIAQAIQRFTDESKIIRDKVDKLENDLLRHFSGNGREATKSKFKMMTYMLQVENNSNPDSKQVNPAQAFIEKTIQKIEGGTTSMYTDRDAKELQDISDKYGKVIGKDDKGNDIIEIDSNKLYNSFSAEEKRILKGLRDINDSMTEKAEFTAAVIRGNRINPINNYISLSTISDDTGNDQFSSIVDIRKMFDSTRQASTKAKSLIERTGRVSAINFDPFSSVRKSSSAVLMDYNMTPTIRESRIALKQLEKDVKEGVLDKSKREFVNALRDSFDLIVDSAIGNNMLQGTTEDAVIAELSKQGYRTMLASVERSMGELISNAAFVTFVAPVTWAKGTAYSKFLMSSDFFNLLKNVGSTQTSRIKPGSTLSNRMVDTSILQQATGLKGASVKSEIRNRAEQIYNLTGKKVKNVAELTADTLISTPDKIMMQPLWMGTFASEFKKEAGVEVDVNKLAANDEAYMDKYADAIEKARREADDITVRAGSTDNAALAVLRNTITPEQKASRLWKWYKTFNGFMSKFLLFEYMTARSAIYQLAKDGRISKKEAVAELAAVTARMTMYSVVISMLGESVIDMAAGLLGYRDDEDDEEEKKKTLAQEAGQGLASTFTTMMFGRNFGNIARAPINIGVEYLNEKYLDFLRNGEYDPYTDQLQYTIAPKEGTKDPFMDIALNTVGPISPFVKTGRFIGKYMYAPEGKTEDKKERQGKEKWRVALEVPGSLGFVPFYNNIRKIQQDWIYGDLGRAEKITVANIGSKIKSAKSAMTRDINEAIKEQSKGEISANELNDRIVQAQQDYLNKINDYKKRLR